MQCSRGTVPSLLSLLLLLLLLLLECVNFVLPWQVVPVMRPSGLCSSLAMPPLLPTEVRWSNKEWTNSSRPWSSKG